ncbi:MBL fold metallo-hydrolase [Rubrobacter tropicus]|uniref:MBL fold metallo-hydrolase n=1 Tax=Rubrobacter tropicus TaxID=2653851 RepID=A0A6G8Q9Y7_9ACTN|nr:MBL fold metallo-hydrolase [Rubrobacter tropicus]QIN83295.1 MBL fold metallo-hydrolase [Rubrobacter tropicus]
MLHRDIADGVHRVGEYFVNWYIVEEDGHLTLVDAGLPSSWHSLLGALKEIGRAPRDVEALVLTHAHFDHIGFAERARAELGIPVWVHENDAPLTKRPWMYMTERSPLSYLSRDNLPIVSSLVRAGAPRVGPICEVRRFGDEETLDVPGSPRVLFTPGHTLGHVSLHFPEREVVITGDALVTHDPYTDTRGPRIVARGATADSERALASLEHLAGTGVVTLLPGHGEPWTGEAGRAVREARRVGVL